MLASLKEELVKKLEYKVKEETKQTSGDDDESSETETEDDVP
jgi:hypothetical protein